MLSMPHFPALQRQLKAVFSQKHLQVSLLVADLWEDFEPWMLRFSKLFAESLLDPLAPLKTRSRGQPITVRNYVPLPEDARKLPGLMSFRDADHAITVLGDGCAREHAYQKYAIKKLPKIQCHAVHHTDRDAEMQGQEERW